MNVDINFDLGCKLVRGKPEEYSHTFGGDIPYDGTVPEGCEFPVHLLFRLDLNDPVLPFKMESEFRFLPFFFAFFYDASPMSYCVRSDNKIEIFGLETPEYVPNCPYPNFPCFFDSVPVSVQPITYEEQRDLAMDSFIYSHAQIYEALPQNEIQRLRSLGYPVTRIGRVHDLLQLAQEALPKSCM